MDTRVFPNDYTMNADISISPRSSATSLPTNQTPPRPPRRVDQNFTFPTDPLPAGSTIQPELNNSTVSLSDSLISSPNHGRTCSLPTEGSPESTHKTIRADSESEAIYTTPGRKFSRKLPPRLTESLELLVLSNPTSSITTPVQEGAAKVFALEADYEIVEQPISEKEPSLFHQKSTKSLRQSNRSTTPTMPFPTSRRNMSISTIMGSISSSSGSQLLTPSSSIRGRPSTEVHSQGVSCSSGSASTCGTWSMDDFDAYHESPTKRKEDRKARKARRKAEKAAFDEDTPPTMRALYDASLMDVIDERGVAVKFGDLVRRGRTIVVFIRHWFCPLCAQYIKSIVDQVSPEALEEADVEMVIIGNGSAKMLPGYKNKAMKCPFRMYTDPTLSVYRALGLTRQTGDAGPDAEAGDYLVQTPLQATISTLKRATQMPLANPGHFLQLGGEFIFDGTLNISYTHRMITTRAHAPIRDICARAGVSLEWVHYEPGPSPPSLHRASPLWSETGLEVVREEDDWRMERDRELARLQYEKEARRFGEKRNVNLGGQGREVFVVGEDEDEVVGVGRHMEGLGIAY